MNKAELRKTMLQKRETLSAWEVQSKSHEINQGLGLLPLFQKANYILTYLSFRKEVETKEMIQAAWQLGKHLLVPICQPSSNDLLISEIQNWDQLAPGTWNILEPRKENLQLLSPTCLDLVILPGVAFDLNGYRLGYGAGYYDRFLLSLSSTCQKIALCFDFQLVDSLPTQEHDVPVDIIITESRIIYR